MDNLVEFLLALIIIGIPCGALAVRFVLRPALKEIVTAINDSKAPLPQEIERRLVELEESQQLIGAKLDQLAEAERFRARLESESAAR